MKTIQNINVKGSGVFFQNQGNANYHHTQIEQGEMDLEDWKHRAEYLEKLLKKEETITEIFLKLLKAIAKKFGY